MYFSSRNKAGGKAMSMGSLADGWDRFPMSQPIHRVWWRLLWAALRWQLRHLGHLGHLRQTLFEYRYPGVCGIRGCLGSWDTWDTWDRCCLLAEHCVEFLRSTGESFRGRKAEQRARRATLPWHGRQ